MMRVISLLTVVLLLSAAYVGKGEDENANPRQEQREIPTTLAEAHAELERILSPEVLAKIDAMPSEDGMALYHMDIGLSIRNGWGLWGSSPLKKHLEELGFTHPDDMSGVILATFWCKRHGQVLRLNERAAAYRKALEDTRRAEEEEREHVQQAKAMIPRIMMGLRFEKRNVPTVEIPTKSGMAMSFMCPFRNGVFLAARCESRTNTLSYDNTDRDRYHADPPDGEILKWRYYDDRIVRGTTYDFLDGTARKMEPGDDFYTVGFYLDPKDGTIRRIRVPEVDEVYAAVVVGGRAWLAGLTNGKAILVGVGDQDRITLPLPWDDEIPDLGMDGQSLLAVYSKAIYRLTDSTWTLLYQGDTLLPRSVLPPQRHGDRVFLRDRGLLERDKRLWWFTLGGQWNLSSLDRNVGVLEAWGPYWREVLSYAIASRGDIWACVGGWNAASLVRCAEDGQYAIALFKGCVRFTEDPPHANRMGQRISVSAVTVLPDDTLLLAGRSGLYRLKANTLVQELAFAAPAIPDSKRGVADLRDWTPSHVLKLSDRSYVIGTALWDGVYLLRKDDAGQWVCLSLDDNGRDSVIW